MVMVTIKMMIMFLMMTSIDHSHDGNDDDESRFHCELIEAVLWVLVGLLFVGATPPL